MCTVGERGHFSLDVLEGEDLSEVAVEVIAEQLPELFAQRSRLDAEIERRLIRFDKGEGYKSDGALNAKAWLRWRCRLSPGEAAERVKLARKLPELELTAIAMSQGAISYRHAALIAKTAAELGDLWETNAEEILVVAARQTNPKRLGIAAEQLKHCLMPDGVLADANRDYERRSLHLSQTLDGLFQIDGQLDSEGGAALKTALDALMRPPTFPDDSSAAKRRADALVELARRQLDGGTLPKVGGQKPHLVVTADLATLTKRPGSAAAELDWSFPIPAETARRIACDCAMTAVVDGESHGTGRVVPGYMRRALVARDKTCRFPGCDMPAAWSDAHHIVHWLNGGPTKLWNLVLLCRRHHRCIHEGGWELVAAGDGLIQAIPP